MKLEINNVTIDFLAIILLVLAITGICLLIKWSREEQFFKIFFYFLISAWTTPLYSSYSEDGSFELWFPIGFTFILLYLLANKDFHASKVKASLLGFAVAIYRLIQEYTDFLI